MHHLAKRGLVWVLAMVLLIAGLPIAHSMPDPPAMQSHQSMHHHDMAAMDDMSAMASADQDDDGEPQSSAPCKCLNCSMCVASFVAAPTRLTTPERRIAAVTYRTAPAGIPGIAVRVDPGIPILGL